MQLLNKTKNPISAIKPEGAFTKDNCLSVANICITFLLGIKMQHLKKWKKCFGETSEKLSQYTELSLLK